MSIMNRNGPDEEELREMQEQMEQDREERQTAQQMASQAAMENRGNMPGYWEIIGRPQIGRDGEASQNIEEFLATELAPVYGLSNISKQDANQMWWRTENEFWTIHNEFQDADSKMGDDDIRMMYGEDRPEMTNEMARRLRTAAEVKKMQIARSVNAEALRRGTEIHAVAKTEERDEEEEGGRLSGIKGWLSG